MRRIWQFDEFYRSIEVPQPREPFPQGQKRTRIVNDECQRRGNLVEVEARSISHPYSETFLSKRCRTVQQDVIGGVASIGNVVEVAAINPVHQDRGCKIVFRLI